MHLFKSKSFVMDIFIKKANVIEEKLQSTKKIMKNWHGQVGRDNSSKLENNARKADMIGGQGQLQIFNIFSSFVFIYF